MTSPDNITPSAAVRCVEAHGMEYNNPQLAFDHAIASGKLSAASNSFMYAGDFMYMGTEIDARGIEVDAFKHIVTRQYTRLAHSWTLRRQSHQRGY